MAHRTTERTTHSSERLAHQAVEHARNSNAEGLQLIRNELALLTDRSSVEAVIMEALLLDGSIRCAIGITDRARVLQWIDQHADILMREKEHLLDPWGWDTNGDSMFTAQYLGIILEALAEKKVDFLHGMLGSTVGVSGVVHVPDAQKTLHRLLQRRPAHWEALSPIWIGAADEPMRKAAIHLGWTPLHLPTMAARHASRPNANAWMQQLSHPYSLAVLGWVQAAMAQQLGQGKQLELPEVLNITNDAKPQDIALAMALIEASPLLLPIRFEGLSQKNVGTLHVQQSVKNIVQTHMDLGFMDDLVLALYQGHVPGLSENESIELPQLGLS